MPANVLKVASDEVTGKGKSLQKLRDQGSSDLLSLGYRSNNKTFSEEQEKKLADYLIYSRRGIIDCSLM